MADNDSYGVLWDTMKSDCSKCSGLCCTALYFSKIDGFPKNKEASDMIVLVQGSKSLKLFIKAKHG